MSKRILVGHYNLGYRNVAVFAQHNQSGKVEIVPTKRSKVSEIEIGINGSWGEALSILLHESFELSFIDVNGRFKREPTYCEESSDYNFFLTHNEFSESAERVGYFIRDVIPDLQKVYNKQLKLRRKEDEPR